jgi:hypothetical protein
MWFCYNIYTRIRLLQEYGKRPLSQEGGWPMEPEKIIGKSFYSLFGQWTSAVINASAPSCGK